MPSITAVVGTDAPRKIERALLSVFDKAGVVEFGQFLAEGGVHLLSTGGTYKKLQEAGVPVQEVSDYTGSPEILDGRVKTLHPKIHGGLLAVRGNASHEAEMVQHGVGAIDLVVVNLYPFEQTVKGGADYYTCMENIDIGGPAMIRAAAKNNPAVCIVTSPDQYALVKDSMKNHGGCSTPELRKHLAAAAFSRTAAYDSAISRYFTQALDSYQPVNYPNVYNPLLTLKYGCNPHQKPAALCALGGHPLPLTVVNGTPGYINLLDAVNAWQLVKELRQATGKAAAASFKHVSPAGAAISAPLTAVERQVFDIGDKKLTDAACAYVRARNADPMCSFGDFAALSDVVDEETALVLKPEVSDGIVAPGYHEKALEILKAKKGGKFIILQADPSFAPPPLEFRDIYGMGFMQKRNDALFDAAKLQNHPKVMGLKFKEGIKRQDRVNGRVRYIEGDFTDIEKKEFDDKFEQVPEPLTEAEKKDFLKTLKGVSISSDAFFPFRDNIDHASKYGVEYIVNPGGSVQDPEVTKAANEYGMLMAMTDLRLFHH
ncbi:unnamed protein product [Vitrella brassicaformis CCMP3155]|uniref:MGS-like domain-containing protein n=1 Tax=Vitrella brassicaformis (strain CCMP3155) TaxID=1169540 RepID=A0A0G4EW12_VITBC|nr:unnamed protein product [Vitrella brassicaformis CCMP3155]|eukprot:CEM02515.1 unnamed protein product [Vitrella brassicaformis CCMP3155]